MERLNKFSRLFNKIYHNLFIEFDKKNIESETAFLF